MVPLANPSPQPKRHLDRLSRFCRAPYCGKPTERSRYSVGSNRLHLYVRSNAMRPNNEHKRHETSEFSSVWQTPQQPAMKLGVLPAESSWRLRWRRRSLWRQVLFLFSGRQGSGLQQISGAVCWPQIRPARSHRPDTSQDYVHYCSPADYSQQLH